MSVADLNFIINQLLPEPHAGLLSGILFGTKVAISPDLKELLTASGTLHIIALSGMNITILASFVDLTFLRFVSRKIASLLTCGIIIGYILFVGISPSVVRAGLMGILALLSTSLGKQRWSLFGLGFSVALMLLFVPSWIFDIGFQLSSLATLGIILFGKKQSKAPQNKEISPYLVQIKYWIQIVLTRYSVLSYLQQIGLFIWHCIEDDLQITLAAQVFTIPIIFFTFHRISLISPLTNILIGWIICPLTILGFGLVFLGLIWLPLAAPLSWVCWLGLQYMIRAITLTAKIPFSNISW